MLATMLSVKDIILILESYEHELLNDVSPFFDDREFDKSQGKIELITDIKQSLESLNEDKLSKLQNLTN